MLKINFKKLDELDKILDEDKIENEKINKIIKDSNSLSNLLDEIFPSIENFSVLNIEDISNLSVKDITKEFILKYLDNKNVIVADLNEELDDEDESILIKEELNGDDYSTDSMRDYMRQICSIPLLSKEEEENLFRRYSSGEVDLRNEIVEHNLRLVVSVAKRYSYNSDAKLLDLIQEGNIGLVKAVERFDVNRGYKFSTYAIWWIKQSIQRYIHNNVKSIRIPEYAVNNINKTLKTQKEFLKNNGVYPTEEELSKLTGFTEEQIKKYLTIDSQINAVSLQTPIGEEDTVLEDFIPDESVDFVDEIIKKELPKEVEKIIDTLTDREKEIIKRRYGLDTYKPQTLGEVGKSFNLSRERVRQIESKAQNKLKARARSLKDYC